MYKTVGVISKCQGRQWGTPGWARRLQCKVDQSGGARSQRGGVLVRALCPGQDGSSDRAPGHCSRPAVARGGCPGRTDGEVGKWEQKQDITSAIGSRTPGSNLSIPSISNWETLDKFSILG